MESSGNELTNWLGLAGVADAENSRAKHVGRLLEIPMLFLAFWVIVLWYAENKSLVSAQFIFISDVVVWAFFVIETCLLTFLVDNKFYHLRANWLNVAIILLGILVVFDHSTIAPALRSMRLLLMLALLVNISSTVRIFLARNHLGITIAFTFCAVIMVGFISAGIDPGIETPWDGIWWAWVTVTTVGYGDIVPTSLAGKILGGILILFGMAVFSLLTASFSAFLISKDEEVIEETEEEIVKQNDIILEKLNEIEQQVSRLSDEVASLRDSD